MPLYPKISIVTPSLNQGHFIDDAIQSVLNQGYPNFEHIVIDGVSTDSTLSVLGGYPHLTWISEPDEGQSDALNKGFRIATGDIVGWLNADDVYLPDCFRTVSEFAVRRPDVNIFYGDFRWIDAVGNVLQFRRELDFDLFMLRYLPFLYIPSTATFFRSKIFEDGNFLNVDYHNAMDYEFILRLALAGYKFAHIKAFFADFRFHGTSKTSLASERQSIETQQASLALDPFLTGFARPGVKRLVKRVLTVVARAKRYFLKATRGYYFSQWPRRGGAL